MTNRARTKLKPTIADRLLRLRSIAGADADKHARYHRLVNRYQRILLKNYVFRYRRHFLSHWHFFTGRHLLRRLNPWHWHRRRANLI